MGITVNEYIINKRKIKLLIEQYKFDEAKSLLKLLYDIKPDDIELFSIEAVIALKENNLDFAQQILETGLDLNFRDTDLLFNYAYLMEKKNEREEAIFYYQKASEYSDNAQIKNEIYQIISYLKNKNKNNGLNTKIITQFPKVSVLIPTYNMKEYLKQAIDSVLSQDYSNLEIIVSDDCSTDGTDEMMKQYYQMNPKVKYFRNEVNLGARKNGQRLLYDLADGTYILGLNHDDYLIQNDYISKAVNLLEEYPNISLVFANLKIYNVKSGEIRETNIDIPTLTFGRDYFLNYEKSDRYPHITSVLTSIYRRKQAIQMKCLLEESECQDLFIYMKLMLIGDIAFIKDHVGVYRIHENSLSFNMPIEYDYSTLKELEELKEYALKLGLNQQRLDRWLLARVYVFVQWRFRNLWSKDKKSAIRLLHEIVDEYPSVFNNILNHLYWR